MIPIQSSRLAQIIIRIVPASSTTSPNQTTREPVRSYDALIYASMPITWPNGITILTPPPGRPSSMAGLPLIAVEHITVRWNRYQEYLAGFFEGEKAPYLMRDRLLEAISPGLQALFSNQQLSPLPVRVWWSSETPELDDLPWELLAYTDRRPPPGPLTFSFVRGVPPAAPVPKLPISGPLRMALIRHQDITSPGLSNGLNNLPPNITVTEFAGPRPREMLQVAAREGYDVIHLVTDGIALLSCEGLLYLFDEQAPRISASELSSILLGSRAGVLSLTPPGTDSPDVVTIANRQVPSAYRAFVYLGRSSLSLPTIIAPVGPIEPSWLAGFWHNFYTTLAETLAVEEARAAGLANVPPVALALFLRQQYRHTYLQATATPVGSASDPAELNAQLQISRDVLSQFREMQSKYKQVTLPDSVARFLDSTAVRQQELQAQLEPYMQAEEGEA